jgi:hypothetical protein
LGFLLITPLYMTIIQNILIMSLPTHSTCGLYFSIIYSSGYVVYAQHALRILVDLYSAITPAQALII